jgi:hypothetical protein
MLPESFIAQFNNANKRLSQKVNNADMETALRFLASQAVNTCLSIQPGNTGYAWSERKVVMVFMWRINEAQIRLRFLKRVSYRNSEVTPGCFKELRAFPLGKVMDKLKSWSEADDGITVNADSLKPLKRLPKTFFTRGSNHEGDIFYNIWHL